MVLRLLLPILFILPIFADVEFGFVRYTGTGGDTIIETGIDSITFVIVAPVSGTPPAGNNHPYYVYMRPSGFDSLGAGAFTPTSFTKDSVCYFGPDDNATTYTDKGIKKWYWPSDSVLLGKHCNRADTNYVMWVLSDPDQIMSESDVFTGTADVTDTISTAYTDTMEAIFWLIPVSFANKNALYYANVTGNSGYYWDAFGERRNNQKRPIAGEFYIEGDFAQNTYENVWIGFKDTSRYVRIDSLLGDADAATNDTIPYNPADGFRAWLNWVSPFPTINTTPDDSFTSWWLSDSSIQLNSPSGADIGATWIKSVIDSMITDGNSAADYNNYWHKFLSVGDTTSFIADGGGTTTTRRQPCEGNATINDKGNITTNDRY